MIAIVNYKAGNIQSVQNALERLGAESIVTADIEQLTTADKVIFPGVGEARQAMRNLQETSLNRVIPELKQPVLGVCLGLQLMCKSTAEGNVDGLGIFDTLVKRFPPKENVPHMGWSDFTALKSELFTDINKSDDVYFVHSYYAEVCAQTIASTNYIEIFSSALQNNNFWATQFHPEKSGAVGDQIIKNFLAL